MMEKVYRKYLEEGERMGLPYSIAVPQAAMRGLLGTQLGKQTGSAIEFQDYREYQPGDDLRSIDWSIYGRTDKLTIKLYRDEVSPHVDIIMDASRSMRLSDSEKVQGGLALTGALAVAAGNGHCSHAVWMGGDGFFRIENDKLKPSAWDGIAFDAKGNLDEAFSVMPPKLRPNGIRILISDLLWIADPDKTLARLANGCASLYVIQLLGGNDIRIPEFGNYRLIDSESGEAYEVFVDETIQQNYNRGLQEHKERWQEACRRHGAMMVTLIAEERETFAKTLERWRVLV